MQAQLFDHRSRSQQRIPPRSLVRKQGILECCSPRSWLAQSPLPVWLPSSFPDLAQLALTDAAMRPYTSDSSVVGLEWCRDLEIDQSRTRAGTPSTPTS